MRSDALVAFVPIGAPLTILGAAIASNTIDLMGSGVGTPPPNIIGNATLFGADMGIGGMRPEINVVTGSVAFAGGTSLQVELQGAVDTATTYQPGTWITFGEVPGITLAQLLANTVIFRLPFLPAWPQSTLPRYLRLLFTPTGTFTAGTIASALVTTVRDDQANKYAAANYKVA